MTDQGNYTSLDIPAVINKPKLLNKLSEPFFLVSNAKLLAETKLKWKLINVKDVKRALATREGKRRRQWYRRH